jgi:hypothetical protein
VIAFHKDPFSRSSTRNRSFSHRIILKLMQNLLSSGISFSFRRRASSVTYAHLDDEPLSAPLFHPIYDLPDLLQLYPFMCLALCAIKQRQRLDKPHPKRKPLHRLHVPHETLDARLRTRGVDNTRVPELGEPRETVLGRPSGKGTSFGGRFEVVRGKEDVVTFS